MEPKKVWLEKIEEFKKNKNFEECLKYASKIKDLDDARNKPEFWYKKGVAHIEIQDFKNALLCFDKDLELNKPNFETLYKKGIVYYFLKKNSDAVEWFNKAWELKYSQYLKTKEQIQLLKDHKEFEKTVMHAKKLNQIGAFPSQFWHYRGLSLTELEKYQEAMKCYDEALLIRPNEPLILFDKARCKFLQGKEKDCIDILKKVYSLDLSYKNKIQAEPVFSSLIQNNNIFD